MSEEFQERIRVEMERLRREDPASLESFLKVIDPAQESWETLHRSSERAASEADEALKKGLDGSTPLQASNGKYMT